MIRRVCSRVLRVTASQEETRLRNTLENACSLSEFNDRDARLHYRIDLYQSIPDLVQSNEKCKRKADNLHVLLDMKAHTALSMARPKPQEMNRVQIVEDCSYLVDGNHCLDQHLLDRIRATCSLTLQQEADVILALEFMDEPWAFKVRTPQEILGSSKLIPSNTHLAVVNPVINQMINHQQWWSYKSASDRFIQRSQFDERMLRAELRKSILQLKPWHLRCAWWLRENEFLAEFLTSVGLIVGIPFSWLLLYMIFS